MIIAKFLNIYRRRLPLCFKCQGEGSLIGLMGCLNNLSGSSSETIIECCLCIDSEVNDTSNIHFSF